MSEPSYTRYMAAALWKAEAIRCEVPQSIIDGRTPDAFEDESHALQERWMKMAEAVIEIQRPTPWAYEHACAALEKTKQERDEADRRAGAAERQMADIIESQRRRNMWLLKAKQDRGYDDNVSFDIVWEETCRLADIGRMSEAQRDNFLVIVGFAINEAERAMKKFPQPNYVLTKFAEEAGEFIKACVHKAEGRETIENVRSEMIQTIAMLYRLWEEGDFVHGLDPIRKGYGS